MQLIANQTNPSSIIKTCLIMYQIWLISFSSNLLAGQTCAPLKIIGSKEHISIAGINFEALVDTGAKTSSLNAQQIKIIPGKYSQSTHWVSFFIEDPQSGTMLKQLKPVIRFIHVLTHSGPPRKRPVVQYQIQLGQLTQNIQFSLSDRQNFPQPVLIGQNLLQQNALLVDSSQYFLATKNNCHTSSLEFKPSLK
ncbi:ATP-dependent zinc protease family protein [Pelagibaculum spongiae]|uniref:ATP-dependent zinc protease family protein n=1 Tax=Pelagibaculum spongiae TaxID=2080658 RepID=UPI001057799D|nr:RimK/LysX family protein [Pelagibaculum spongiae]